MQTRVELDPALRVYIGRYVVQLIPEGISKAACAAHFRTSHPALNAGSRVLSIADQGFQGEAVAGLLMRRGVDAEILSADGGVSVGYPVRASHEPDTFRVGRTGVLGTALILDNAVFQLPLPRAIASVRIEREARIYAWRTRDAIGAVLGHLKKAA